MVSDSLETHAKSVLELECFKRLEHSKLCSTEYNDLFENAFLRSFLTVKKTLDALE